MLNCWPQACSRDLPSNGVGLGSILPWGSLTSPDCHPSIPTEAMWLSFRFLGWQIWSQFIAPAVPNRPSQFVSFTS